jgi:hypothetical protein
MAFNCAPSGWRSEPLVRMGKSPSAA